MRALITRRFLLLFATAMIAPVIADNLKTAGILSVGNTIDPAEAYRNFRGRDPKVEALMKKRGFPS